MKRAVLIVLVVFSHFAQAQSVLLGKKLIGKGDDVARARDAAGEPSKMDRIDGDDSSPAMEIWTYRRDDRVITLWVVGGKIVKATEETAKQDAGAAAGS
jgi:hypothetical protein